MASISGFHHTAIRSTRFDEVVAFYTGILGLQIKITWGETPKRAAMIDAGDGNYVEVFEREEAASDVESALMHFALRTDDCAAMTEKIRAAGLEITMEPREVNLESSAGIIPVKISFFKGPAGEVVELFENAVL